MLPAHIVIPLLHNNTHCHKSNPDCRFSPGKVNIKGGFPLVRLTGERERDSRGKSYSAKQKQEHDKAKII